MQKVIRWDCGRDECGFHNTKQEAIDCCASDIVSIDMYLCNTCGDEYLHEDAAINCCSVEYLTKKVATYTDLVATNPAAKRSLERLLAEYTERLKKAIEKERSHVS